MKDKRQKQTTLCNWSMDPSVLQSITNLMIHTTNMNNTVAQLQNIMSNMQNQTTEEFQQLYKIIQQISPCNIPNDLVNFVQLAKLNQAQNQLNPGQNPSQNQNLNQNQPSNKTSHPASLVHNPAIANLDSLNSASQNVNEKSISENKEAGENSEDENVNILDHSCESLENTLSKIENTENENPISLLHKIMNGQNLRLRRKWELSSRTSRLSQAWSTVVLKFFDIDIISFFFLDNSETPDSNLQNLLMLARKSED